MAYRTQSPDTSEEFERVQFAHLRAAGREKRWRLAQAHIASCVRQTRAQLAKQHPEWSRQEVALQWAALVYGEELAARVRQHLEKRSDLE